MKTDQQLINMATEIWMEDEVGILDDFIEDLGGLTSGEETDLPEQIEKQFKALQVSVTNLLDYAKGLES